MADSEHLDLARSSSHPQFAPYPSKYQTVAAIETSASSSHARANEFVELHDQVQVRRVVRRQLYIPDFGQPRQVLDCWTPSNRS
jgi:hypothetical protein